MERAKTGDLLKAKIQQRPNRQELERRHILEHEESHVDPSLAEKQRMLKKARLADQLNSQLSHRPGPLELIKKNILHVEEPIERIVKEGLVSFRATSEGLLNRPQHPQSYVTFEDDSQNSSESGCGVGAEQISSPQAADLLEVAATSAGIVTVALTIPTSGGAVVVTSGPILQSSTAPLPACHSNKMPALLAVPPPPPPPLPIPLGAEIKTEFLADSQLPPTQIKSETPQRFAELCQSLVGAMSPSPTLVPIYPAAPKSFPFSPQTLCTLSPLSSSSGAAQSLMLPRPVSVASPLPAGKFDAPGKDKYRKKSKCKQATKARPIKFHEYKGPPNAAQKNSSVSQSQTEETSYQLLLKQQNFLLEYLEGLHKQPAAGAALQQPPKPQILMMTETNFLQKPSFATISNNTAAASLINTHQPVPSPAPSVASTVSTETSYSCAVPPTVDLNRLEKMKVSDLKLLLKKRNLPVSGPKPQLIERLKPYLPLENTVGAQQQHPQIKMESGSHLTSASDAGELCDFEAFNSPHLTLSPVSEHELMDVQNVDSPAQQQATLPVVVLAPLKEDLVREQQRKIDELQRKLKESQDELLQMKQNHTAASQIQSKEQPVNQKLIFKQQLEAKIQKEKMQQIENLQRQQKEYLANQQQVLKNAAAAAVVARSSRNNKPPLIAAHSQPVLAVVKAPIKEEAPALAFNENALQHLSNKNKNVEIVWNGEQALFLVGLPQPDGNNNNPRMSVGHQRTSSMPSILVPISAATGQLQGQILIQQKAVPSAEARTAPLFPMQDEKCLVEPKLQPVQDQKQQPMVLVNVGGDAGGTNQKKRVHRNSQMMTDVLEILIKNGDLPESAAQAPGTPVVTPVSPVITSAGLNAVSDGSATTTTTTAYDTEQLTMLTEPVSPPAQSMQDDMGMHMSQRPHEVMGDLDLSSMLRNLADPSASASPAADQETDSSLVGGLQEQEGEAEDHVTKTLDLLLNGHNEEPKRDDILNRCSGLGANDVVMSNSVAPGAKISAVPAQRFLSGAEEMDHFDEIEFMALMKLDMELADQNCTSQLAGNGLRRSGGMELMQGHAQSTPGLYNSFVDDLVMDDSSSTLNTGPTNSLVGDNDRSADPYRRPGGGVSSTGTGTAFDHNGNPTAGGGLNLMGDGHRFTEDTPMDIEDFSNSLSAFDFPFVDSASGTQSAALAPPQRLSQPNQLIGNGGHAEAAPGMSFEGLVNGARESATASVHSSSMNFSALQNTSSGSSNNNNNSSSQGSVFGSINSLNDQLGMVDVPTSLLYESHLPMGHDYSLELFDELRIPTDSMSWNELDFPIYGK